MADKPSFFSSLTAGAIGMVKGTLALGIIGALVGSGVGAIAGASGLLAGTAVLADAAAVGLSATFTGAVLGSALFAQLGSSLGGIAGAVTGVMQNREQHGADAQDVTNIANMAFAQGIEAGRSQHVSEQSKQEVKTAADHFQKQLAAEKSGVAAVRGG